jgi:hypothetical protein
MPVERKLHILQQYIMAWDGIAAIKFDRFLYCTRATYILELNVA